MPVGHQISSSRVVWKSALVGVFDERAVAGAFVQLLASPGQSVLALVATGPLGLGSTLPG